MLDPRHAAGEREGEGRAYIIEKQLEYWDKRYVWHSIPDI